MKNILFNLRYNDCIVPISRGTLRFPLGKNERVPCFVKYSAISSTKYISISLNVTL